MFNFYWVNRVSFIVNVTSIALINIIEEHKCLGVNLPNNMLLQNYPQKYGSNSWCILNHIFMEYLMIIAEKCVYIEIWLAIVHYIDIHLEL